MTVPEGIVERKDLKIVCAPPWGTNYEMKAKKNSKQLSFFHDERQGKIRSPINPGRNTGMSSRAVERSEGFMKGDSAAMDREISQHDLAHSSHYEGETGDTESNRYENHTGSEVEESHNSVMKSAKSNAHSQMSSSVLDHTPSPQNPKSEQDRFCVSRSEQDVRPKAKTQYETSNSAYGFHQSEAEEGNLPKSYRRVSSFSKLYGDTQPWKK